MGKATVLIADDHPVVVEMVAALLEREGYAAVRAMDGEEALAAALELQPDLVILDIEMPKLDGWEVLARLREVSEVPVLMLSAEGGEAQRARGSREGADDYATKPVKPREFLGRVEALLGRGGSAGGAEAEAH